jgi:hypothetical protein
MPEPRLIEAEKLHAIGREFAMDGHFAAAEQMFRCALAIYPEEPAWRVDLALSVLGQKRLAEGFALYRDRLAPRPDLDCPEWQGEDLAGRSIVLFPEQGFGDQIMFARFAPYLRVRGADVTLLCAPSLVRLFESLGVRTLAAAGAVSFPDPDYWAMAQDVPGRLGLGIDQIPNAPYLSASPRGSGGIGAVLRGNSRTAISREKFPDPGLELPFPAINLQPQNTRPRDFLDTAELVMGLDAVVSVDTAIAHLAGALGKPVFLMLPAYGADWRWFSGSSSPWYPSMHLYRQRARGDWAELVERVAGDLPT